MPTPGMVLADNYRIESEIGRGGMGSVWRAKRLDLDADVAVKVLHVEASQRADLLGRFSREAKATASLSSPHVIRIIDFGVDAATEHAFLVMELLEGETLRQRLSRERPLPLQLVARVLTQVGRALEQAHALGIVHRDLKPGNIFLVNNADEELVKLLDFGIAKADDAADDLLLTQTGNVLGTPQYMSPEQLTSSKAVDHRSDLWSLAVIAYECLVGRRPFRGASAAELAMKISLGRSEPPSSVAAVPPGFDEWFARATEVAPERRFQSARELTQALQRLSSEAAPSQASSSERVSAPRVGLAAAAGASRAGRATVALPLSAPASAAFALAPTLEQASEPLQTDAALATSNTGAGVSSAVSTHAAAAALRPPLLRWLALAAGVGGVAAVVIGGGALLRSPPEAATRAVTGGSASQALAAQPTVGTSSAVVEASRPLREEPLVGGRATPALAGALPHAALAVPGPQVEPKAASSAPPAAVAPSERTAGAPAASAAPAEAASAELKTSARNKARAGRTPAKAANASSSAHEARRKRGATPKATPPEVARPASKRNPLDAYDWQ